MRASGISARMMDLQRLLESINKGRIALPEFQRDFDWSEEDVKELLITTFTGWPAGSLLLLQGRHDLFRLRAFEGAPTDLSQIRYVVLDGQQRLTSLYHALFKKGSTVYAIRVGAVDQTGEIEDAIEAFSRHTWDEDYDDLENQTAEGLIPCYELTSAAGFFEWRDEVVRFADSPEAYKNRLTRLYKTTLAAIHRYEFPTVVLEESIDPAAIASIFERVNRLGMRLNTFDLMVAKVFEPDWNLRDHWEDVKNKYQPVAEFLDDDGMPILQTTALRFEEDVRQSAVLRLEKETVHEDWSTAARGVDEAIRFFLDNCGVTDYKTLPYKVMLVLFAAVAIERSLSEDSFGFTRLFWALSFGQAYDVAANTRVTSDYSALLSQDCDPSELSVPDINEERLYYSARRSHRAVWAAFTSFLRSRDSTGLFSEFIDADEPEECRVVSVLPKGMKPEMPEVAPPHLRVLGLVHAPREISLEISREGFTATVERQMREEGEEAVAQSLQKQFIPSVEYAIETPSNWKALFRARLSGLLDALEDRYGLGVESWSRNVG